MTEFTFTCYFAWKRFQVSHPTWGRLAICYPWSSLNFRITVNNYCFIQQKYLYSEKLHAHKKWYNALCCVWTWFLALQLFQLSHEPLANRHKSWLGQGSNNFCIQISYNVYICCIWSTLNSGRLNQYFSDSELIFKCTNTKMQRCHDEKANTQRTLPYLTLANSDLLSVL